MKKLDEARRAAHADARRGTDLGIAAMMPDIADAWHGPVAWSLHGQWPGSDVDAFTANDAVVSFRFMTEKCSYLSNHARG